MIQHLRYDPLGLFKRGRPEFLQNSFVAILGLHSNGLENAGREDRHAYDARHNEIDIPIVRRKDVVVLHADDLLRPGDLRIETACDIANDPDY